MTPTPNPQPPLVISEEAREAAEFLHEQGWTHPPMSRSPQGYEAFYVMMAKDIQPFLNAATEKLTKENEELKEQLSHFDLITKVLAKERDDNKAENQTLTTRIKELEEEEEVERLKRK